MKRPASQHGATLIITLTILIVVMMLGASSVSLRSLEEHAARNHYGLMQARLAAQAALDDALVDLRRARSKKDGPIPDLNTATFGEFTTMNATFDPDHLPAPRYEIARVKIPASRPIALYRISAWGFGAGRARATLQMLVTRQQPEDGPVTLDVLGWRRGTLP